MNSLAMTAMPIGPVAPDADEMMPAEKPKIINRERPEAAEQRKANVKEWTKRIADDKAHFAKHFERMRGNQAYARRGAARQWAESGKYVANIVQRHIAQRVAALYAKNPKTVARRKKRMDFSMWDGKQDSLQAAMQSLQQPVMDPITGQPAMNPEAVALLQDVVKGFARRQMLDNLAKTLELLYTHQVSEQTPPFKKRMKSLVRRAITTGVGYVKLGFHRAYEMDAEVLSRAATMEEKLANIQTLMADLADGEKDEASAEVDKLKIAIDALHKSAEAVSFEGLTFDFPGATSIIPHKRCVHLNTFLGCDWVTEEHLMTVDEVKEVFRVDLKKGSFRPYVNGTAVSDRDRDGLACVWETYNKKDGTVLFTVDGYEDFLKEPAEPEVKLERFWPWFVLTLNDVDDEENIYPPSDVELLKSMQDEYNRSRQGLREHRAANRPLTVTRRGALTEEDKDIVRRRPANSLIELDGLAPTQKVDDLMQVVKGPPIDQSLYDTEFTFSDVLRVIGTQEANLGGTAGGTATEASIAEGSRMSALSSNVDDLDDLLTELARAGGQVLLMQMSKEQVVETVGPGAVWPELSGEEIASEVYLEIEGASSGRPNKAQELANLERMAPTMLQVPGMSPEFLLRLLLQRLDDRIEIEDAYQASMPAITALNRIASSLPGQAAQAPAPGVSTGDPATDPAQQGGAGGFNAPAPQETEMTAPAPPARFENMMMYSADGSRMQ